MIIVVSIMAWSQSVTATETNVNSEVYGINIDKLTKYVGQEVANIRGDNDTSDLITREFVKGWTKYKISPLLLLAIGKKESHLNHVKKNGEVITGDSGRSIGIMQINRKWSGSWGRNAGFDPPIGDLKNVSNNVRGCCLILQHNGVSTSYEHALFGYNHSRVYVSVVMKTYNHYSKEFWTLYSIL